MNAIPLLPADGPVLSRAARRTRAITLELLAFVLVTVLAPLLLTVAAAVDLFLWLRSRKPWTAIRMVAVLWWFLFVEMRGMTILLGIWLRGGGPISKDTPARRRRVFAAQVGWAAGHLNGIRRIFGLRFEVEGADLVAPGPVLVLIRHASIVDNTFPATFVSAPHGLDLRYVLKRELQMLPTLDVGGHWVPTCFVRRASDDAPREVAQVRSLGAQLGAGEGVLIYPEGTRYTAPKLARAQAKIAAADPEVGLLAARLRNVLPPRLGGPLALLDEARDAAVVICGHVGLDGFEYISDIWPGGLVGATIRVRFWRFEAATIPTGERERIGWLYERWQELDDWVGEQRGGAGALPPKAATNTLASRLPTR